MTDPEEVQLAALVSWPKAKELAEQIVHERNQAELPERVNRVRAIIGRFEEQIRAQGVDPQGLIVQQETDLMRAGLSINPLYLRSQE